MQLGLVRFCRRAHGRVAILRVVSTKFADKSGLFENVLGLVEEYGGIRYEAVKS